MVGPRAWPRAKEVTAGCDIFHGDAIAEVDLERSSSFKAVGCTSTSIMASKLIHANVPRNLVPPKSKDRPAQFHCALPGVGLRSADLEVKRTQNICIQHSDFSWFLFGRWFLPLDVSKAAAF